MSLGDIYQQTAVSIMNASPVANVFYTKVLAESTPSDTEVIAANALNNNILAALAPVQGNDLDYECILSRKVSPVTSPSTVILITRSGTAGVGEFPNNVAVVFRTYAGNGDKRHRGRWFIPGLIKSWVSEGRIDQAHIGTYQTAQDAMIASFGIPQYTFRLQHFSPYLGTYTDIENVIVNPIPTKMRGRTPGTCSIT